MTLPPRTALSRCLLALAAAAVFIASKESNAFPFQATIPCMHQHEESSTYPRFKEFQVRRGGRHSNRHRVLSRSLELGQPTMTVTMRMASSSQDLPSFSAYDDDEERYEQQYENEQQQEDQQHEEHQRSMHWVLLVDDEEAIRKAVGQLLYDCGYQVTACADAFTAMKVVTSRSSSDAGNANHNQLPDCIISDVRMPQMDGIQFLQQIRSNPQLNAIPVVLLTAKSMTQDRIAGYDYGADAYITKPFDPDELIAIVDNVIYRRSLLSGSDLNVEDLQSDVAEMKKLLLQQGGSGIGNGWVEQTDVFLTENEQAILDYLCEGYSNKEVAGMTYISVRRVEQLLTQMYRKTKTKNRMELVRWALSTGNSQA